MDEDGGNQRQLSHNRRTDFDPAWSIYGLQLAYTSCTAQDCDIWVMDATWSCTDRAGRLGCHPDHVDARLQEDNPNSSPDQDSIVFDACEGPTFPCPGSANYDIYVMRNEGSAPRRLTTDPAIDANAAWSPDQTRIVFRSDRSPDGTELYSMNADGSNVTQLTFGPQQGGVDPDWQSIPD